MDHNKLVRDNIPEIIIENGETPITRTLDDTQYVEALVAKLGEEYKEFLQSKTIEELADMQEVILALADVLDSRQKLEEVRLDKAKKRGGFRKRIFLEKTE